MVTFFVQGLGLALAAKSCLDRQQAFKKVNNDQTLPEETAIFFSFFSERTDFRYS